MTTTSDCVFCKIRDGQIPAMKIFEDERTFAAVGFRSKDSGERGGSRVRSATRDGLSGPQLPAAGGAVFV